MSVAHVVWKARERETAIVCISFSAVSPLGEAQYDQDPKRGKNTSKVSVKFKSNSHSYNRYIQHYFVPNTAVAN